MPFKKLYRIIYFSSIEFSKILLCPMDHSLSFIQLWSEIESGFILEPQLHDRRKL